MSWSKRNFYNDQKRIQKTHEMALLQREKLKELRERQAAQSAKVRELINRNGDTDFAAESFGLAG